MKLILPTLGEIHTIAQLHPNSDSRTERNSVIIRAILDELGFETVYHTGWRMTCEFAAERFLAVTVSLGGRQDDERKR